MSTRAHSLVDVGPSQLGHRASGRGPDVVFVHGWPLDGDTFRHVVPHLEGSFRCHVLDLPGTARSVWSESTPITIRGHADAVRRAIDVLGLDRVALVAHDSGAAVARLVAAEIGARCTGLVLGNTEIPGYHPPLLELMVRTSRLPGGMSILPAMMRSRRIRRSFLGFGGCFTDPAFVDGEFGRLFVEPLLSDRRRAAGQLALLERFEWSVLDEMARTHSRIEAPALLVWGADDPWFPLEKARPMVGQFGGGAELEVLRPGKLFVHEERPRDWAAIAKRFLEREAARRAA
jgi:pimeloyl-ACP methyl ester carboxylesterase